MRFISVAMSLHTVIDSFKKERDKGKAYVKERLTIMSLELWDIHIPNRMDSFSIDPCEKQSLEDAPWATFT